MLMKNQQRKGGLLMVDIIVCKKCGSQIDITAELSEAVKRSMEKELYEKEQIIVKMNETLLSEKQQFEIQKDTARKEFSEKMRAEKLVVQEDLKAASELKKKMQVERDELARKEADFEFKLKEELGRRQAQVEKEIRDKVFSEINEAKSKEIESLKELISDQKKRIESFRDEELKLVNERIKLEEKERELELNSQKLIAEKINQIKDQERMALVEETKFQIMERDKKIHDLSGQLSNMQLKLEQGSQKTQGDMLEEDLGNELEKLFPSDQIQRALVGAPGGDLIHSVFNNGKKVGQILWEAKNTKTFNNLWVEKAKKDMQTQKCDVAVIVTRTLPDSAQGQILDIRDDVIIVHTSIAKVVAALLRNKLIRIHSITQKVNNATSKRVMLYDYAVSQEFRSAIHGVYETINRLTEQSNTDRQFFERSISKRQKHVEYLLKLISEIDSGIDVITSLAEPVNEDSEVRDTVLAGSDDPAEADLLEPAI
jgi:hypothetical protein